MEKQTLEGDRSKVEQENMVICTETIKKDKEQKRSSQ